MIRKLFSLSILFVATPAIFGMDVDPSTQSSLYAGSSLVAAAVVTASTVSSSATTVSPSSSPKQGTKRRVDVLCEAMETLNFESGSSPKKQSIQTYGFKRQNDNQEDAVQSNKRDNYWKRVNPVDKRTIQMVAVQEGVKVNDEGHDAKRLKFTLQDQTAARPACVSSSSSVSSLASAAAIAHQQQNTSVMSTASSLVAASVPQNPQPMMTQPYPYGSLKNPAKILKNMR